jgi:uncharacterized integral membrane protein
MTRLKIIVLGLFAAALAAVILQNRAPVSIDFLFISCELPLIVLLGLTALAGFIIGLLCAALLWPGAEKKT